MFDGVDTNETYDDLEWVPANLEKVPPGYVLAAMLDDIDIDRCSGFDRVRIVQAHERMRAHYTARSYHAMTTVVDSLKGTNDEDHGSADEAAVAGSAEIAAALRLTRRAADAEMSLALELQRRLPRVWEALCDGLIDVRRARVLVNNTLHLPIAASREVVDKVIDDASLLTTGQLAAKIRKLCIDTDPDDAAERYRHATADRRVVVEANSDGTANLHVLNIPPHKAVAAKNRINHLAMDLKRNGDPRTLDQIRTDVLLDLIEGDGTAAGRGVVHLTIDLESLMKLVETPGELAGYGPVAADIARQITQDQQDTEWQWTVTHPATGMPVAGGVTRRRPTTAQKRYLHSLYRTCIHPGCRMPAVNSDIDHRVPWAQRHRTDTGNLYPLCRYHHNLKTSHGWTYAPQPGGDPIFTTPLGHKYTTSGRSP